MDFNCTEEQVAIIFAGAFTITSFSLLVIGGVCSHTGAWISDRGSCTGVYISGLILTALVGVAIYMYLLKLFVDCASDSVVAVRTVGAVRAVRADRAVRTDQTVRTDKAKAASRVLHA